MASLSSPRPTLLLKRLGRIVLLCVGAAVVLSCVQWYRRTSRPPPAPPATAAPANDRLVNYRLSEDFLRWYQLNYIQNSRRGGGTSTDIDDLVKEIGFEQTVQRYVAPYRLILDCAAAHPGLADIPPGDIDQVGRLQYEHVLAIVRSSRRWIDYTNEDVRKGILDSYGVGNRALTRFFQRLLAAPTPPGNPEFKTLIRTTLTRQEFADVMKKTDESTRIFYVALKRGVPWYVLWGPWVRAVLDRSCEQDIALHQRTVDEIYGVQSKPAERSTGGHR